MTPTPDMAKFFKETFGALPVDPAFLQETFKKQAAFGEKLTALALEAAEKSTEISSQWARSQLSRLGALSSGHSSGSDVVKSLGDYATSSAEIATQNIAAFAEVAKKAQMETIALMLSAGKQATQESASAFQSPPPAPL